jgi:hypothetical protein
MVSSGILRRVALVRTDFSEELSASFIRVTRIDELGTTLALTSNRRTLRRNTNAETDPVSETLCFLFVEIRTMDKVQKLNSNQCGLDWFGAG